MIRLATKDDLPRLLTLGKEMHEESNYASFSYYQEGVEKMLTSLLDGGGVIFVAERGGEVIGGIAGMVYSPFFTKDKVATDMGLFISKTTRGLMTAPLLIKTFTNWAEEQPGVKQIRPGISLGGKTEGVSKLYERCGYQTVGAVFMKEV